MPRARSNAKARQAAFETLVEAACALALRHRTDQAHRGEPTPEFFDHPALGRQENCLMVPVLLLNRLAAAVTQFRQAVEAPAAPPGPALPIGPIAANGLDC